MTGVRSAWIAARARNAARNGWWIAGVGVLAIIGTAMVLILVPRAADRQLQQQIAALPVTPDTLPILQRIDSLRGGLTRLERARQEAAGLDTSIALPRSLAFARDSFIATSRTDSLREAADRDALRDAQRDAQREERRAVEQRIDLEQSLLGSVRARSDALEREREQLELRRAPRLPTLGILFAALVVGVSAGYTAVLARELRRPTVGDVTELQRITAAPILIHAGARVVSRSLSRSLSRSVHETARRERQGVPTIIDRESDTFAAVHLTLTGVGDTVGLADVLSDTPHIAAAVALSTAAVAAAESRAVLVVDGATRHGGAFGGVLAKVVGVLRRANAAAPSSRETANADALDAALHTITLDRDTTIDLLLEPPTPSSAWDRLASRYDLRLTQPTLDDAAALASRDVIVCVQQGHTSLMWLARAMAHTRARDQRIRALVLWTCPAPKV